MTRSAYCTSLAAIIVPLLGVALSVGALILLRWCSHRRRTAPSGPDVVCEDKMPSAPAASDAGSIYDEIAAATNNFAPDLIVGRGGFGPVYKGIWAGRHVAVKALDSTSMQGIREFEREVSVLTQYRHQHLVPLLASCLCQDADSGSRSSARPGALLVFPLMARALDEALAGRTGPPLTASARLRLAADVAAGLRYLHSPGDRLAPILHRDVKSSNVLLDDVPRARLADAGLARPAGRSGTTMTGGVGTFGYIDPEYIATGEFTPQSDVFSFGVVLLEILTGARPLDQSMRPQTLYLRMRSCLPDQTHTVMDRAAGWETLSGCDVARQFASIAVRCVEEFRDDRPPLDQALAQLESLLDILPSAPSLDCASPAPTVRSECLVCLAAPRRTRLHPCHHAILCLDCAASLLQRPSPLCPACRAAVGRYEEGDFRTTFAPP